MQTHHLAHCFTRHFRLHWAYLYSSQRTVTSSTSTLMQSHVFHPMNITFHFSSMFHFTPSPHPFNHLTKKVSDSKQTTRALISPWKIAHDMSSYNNYFSNRDKMRLNITKTTTLASQAFTSLTAHDRAGFSGQGTKTQSKLATSSNLDLLKAGDHIAGIIKTIISL